MSGGGVSERHRGSDQARKHRFAQAPGFTRRTAINLPGVLNELTDGRGGPADTARWPQSVHIGNLGIRWVVHGVTFPCARAPFTNLV